VNVNHLILGNANEKLELTRNRAFILLCVQYHWQCSHLTETHFQNIV